MDNPRYQQNTGILGTAQTQIRRIQINSQHSKSATYNLMKTTETDETDLIFIQEPYEYQNRPAGIGKKHRIFTAGTGKQSGHNNHKQQHRRHTNNKNIR
jgi:hypothetical protein